VGPRAGLDAGARRKIPCPCQGSIPDRPAPSQTLYARNKTRRGCNESFPLHGVHIHVSQVRFVHILSTGTSLALH
jgi:hypothetical protein